WGTASSTCLWYALGWRNPAIEDFTRSRFCPQPTGGGAIRTRCWQPVACGTRRPARKAVKRLKLAASISSPQTRTFNGPKPSIQDRRSHGRQGQGAARRRRIERHLREALQVGRRREQ